MLLAGGGQGTTDPQTAVVWMVLCRFISFESNRGGAASRRGRILVVRPLTSDKDLGDRRLLEAKSQVASMLRPSFNDQFAVVYASENRPASR